MVAGDATTLAPDGNMINKRGSHFCTKGVIYKGNKPKKPGNFCSFLLIGTIVTSIIFWYGACAVL